MILIADSGSTKTDWCLVGGNGVLKTIATQGINPVVQDYDCIVRIFNEELSRNVCGVEITEIHFYGSGCREDMILPMKSIIQKTFPRAGVVKVYSDLLGAARALCGCEEGIASILGTGSNSCLFDGQRIVKNVPPLGYVLGDEGSGAVMGKLFVNALFKGIVPEDVKRAFLKDTGIGLSDIIENVYRRPMANRFLASLTPFIGNYKNVAEVRNVIIGNFRMFFRNNVAAYSRADLKIGAVGSIAYYFHEELKEAAALEGFCMGRIMRSPMEGLVRFHTENMQS
ncbi:ATPase [Xylanibacter muris]|uniref:ATPase n=1 Tax=Xylanibacter muris TaxID=2736290 RepID=A0ABX2AK00_9BACT|nr:ATPase [Xylanibacter muris]NPD91478.1 ATPase [Xylanibacter muris]